MKLSVNKSLLKARSYARKGETERARDLYKKILCAYPNNKRAQIALAGLNNPIRSADLNSSEEAINQLVTLYHQGQLETVVERASQLTAHFPASIILWNLIGACNSELLKFEAAETAFHKAIELEPNSSDTQNNLGITLRQQGKYKDAIRSFKKALSLKPDFAEAHFNLGLVFQDLNYFEEAITAFKLAIKYKSNYAEAYFNLGSTLHHHGKLNDAIEAYKKAILIQPAYAEAYNNMGASLNLQGELSNAIDAYVKAISIWPDFAEAYNNMGNTLTNQKKYEDAIATYNNAISLMPEYAEAYSNMGNALSKRGKYHDAIAACLKAISLKPDYAEAYNNMGVAFTGQGEHMRAINTFRDAIALNAGYAEAHNNMGLALLDQGELKESITAFKTALSIKPTFLETRCNLSHAFQRLQQFDDAIACLKETLKTHPNFIEAHNNLGDILKEVGELDEAVSCFKKAYTLEPSFVAAHSNCLLAMHYCQGQTAATLYELHKAWNEDHAQEFQSLWPTHSNSRASDRRLRVGFVSPDLGRHPVGYFTVGLFEHLLKEEVRIIAYSDRNPDALTERIRAATDEWNETAGISDEALADKILTDNIDILFDLTGHSANNRLLVFARKPAPVQVSWAGYVGTTGLSAMDYYLSDKFSTREEEEPFYSEKVIRMPDSWLCYTPPNYAPAVGPSPYKENGYITFCSFSNPAKINDATLSVWSKIISAIPNSILLIKYGGIDSNANRKRLESNFEKNGINLSRLILEGKSPHAELLARYNDADIALDPFPYSGGLTTTEALWMGVPVITLPGDTFASRHSLSYLSVLGFPELIAKTEAEYIEIAIDLATDTDKLVNLRATLRGKMSNSPICDYENFAKNFTAIMRDIWKIWSEKTS